MELPEVLVVDDERASLTALARLVEKERFKVRTADSLASAREEIDDRTPDIVLCDLVLPDGHGTELFEDLEAHPHVETILVTANATVESAVEALRLGAYDYLTKPVDVTRLRTLLRNLRRGLSLRRDLVTLRRQLRDMGRFGDMVGTSPAMQEVFDLIERVAPTDATVLVTGASGTGKELVAETIHRISRRSDGEFIPINCGAVSPQLIESELFGHEKGSFTGADRRHRGVFERADGGTLLLDEITEMSEDLQVKLLRVLETGAFRRVGGNRALEVDVRIIAATNRNPERAVDEGKLREDLFYRLNVFPIPMPTLDERGDDIKLLAIHFLGEMCRSAELVKEFDDAALEALTTSHWPGNVRELRNAVERAFILARDVITPDCLPAECRQTALGPRVELQARVGTPLDDVIQSHTLATLEHFEGNKKQAAAALGISLKTLYNRLKSYDPDDPVDDR
ncbi:MAG: sigma-54 dependent transcriptional regulator [Thermoanaerobaculales bacterium]|nr:sigma-54 dependent transcriptional regulator [Thermoanaerobaculales bacterium]